MSTNVVGSTDLYSDESKYYDETKIPHYYPQYHIQPSSEYSTSMVLAFLKSLRLGMDLTSVTAPAWTLKGRSMLEALADSVKPNRNLILECCPAEKTNPEHRLLNVLAYALAGICFVPKKGLNSIKPYNPILGEVFECEWDHSEVHNSTTCCVVEQISHHPPISAYFLQNKAAGFTVEGVEQLKPIFRGNTVEVANLGEQRLYLHNHRETYFMRKPSYLAKGLFWGSSSQELASDGYVGCIETGLFAKVKFEYGGRFSGEVWRQQSSQRQALYQLSGSVEESLIAKNLLTGQSIELINFMNMPVFYKRVKPLSQMKDNESRKVWHTPTVHLLNGDPNTANRYKAMIEDEQRKLRATPGFNFSPKLFSPLNFKTIDGQVEMYAYNGLLQQQDNQQLSAALIQPLRADYLSFFK